MIYLLRNKKCFISFALFLFLLMSCSKSTQSEQIDRSPGHPEIIQTLDDTPLALPLQDSTMEQRLIIHADTDKLDALSSLLKKKGIGRNLLHLNALTTEATELSPSTSVTVLVLKTNESAESALEFLKENGYPIVSVDSPVQLNLQPNDIGYSQNLLYGLSKLDISKAWDITTGSSSVLVGVLDTGIDYNHSDLAANIYTDAKGFHGYNFIADNTNPMDDHYHGTHVAGTIGAVGNNSVGVVGVNWKVKLVAIKVFNNSGSGTITGIIRGINYATDKNIPILNMSFGTPSDSDGGATISAAIANASQKGILAVAAAGNSKSNNDTNFIFPASSSRTLDNLIAVCATDSSDAMASFSNYGPLSVALCAPGVGIMSTVTRNRYARLDGTSMAAPHVTGVAALLKSMAPEATYKQLVNRLKTSVDVIASLSGKVTSSGRINAYKALSAGKFGPVIVKVTPSANMQLAPQFSNIYLQFNKPMNIASFNSDNVQIKNPNGTVIPPTNFLISSDKLNVTVRFAEQSLSGTYTLNILPSIKDTDGLSMDQNQSGSAGEQADFFQSTFNIAEYYNISVAKIGAGKGLITSSTGPMYCGNICGANFNVNQKLVLTATPDAGNSFDGWQNCPSASGATCTLTVTENKTLLALFSPLPSYELSVVRNGDGSGSVSSSGVSPAIACAGSNTSGCSQKYPKGTVVSLNAVATAGSTFVGWSGACTGSGVCSVSMSDVKNVTATFNLIPVFYGLSVSITGSGAGSVSSSGVSPAIACAGSSTSGCIQKYPKGTVVSLNAVATAGSTFAGWSGACTGSGVCSVSMSDTKNVTATFNLIPVFYDLSVSIMGSGAGSVSSSGISPAIACLGSSTTGCSQKYLKGTVVSLNAVAAAGSTFAGWSGACTGSGACNVNMSDVKNVTATFNLIPRLSYRLTIKHDGKGFGSVSFYSNNKTTSCTSSTPGSTCSTDHLTNTTLNLYARPAIGKVFLGWTGACSGKQPICTVKMDRDQTVTAIWK